MGSTKRIAIEAAQRVAADGAGAGEPRMLAGGARHDAGGIDASVGGQPRELVVRVSPAGRADHEKTRREFEVLRVAFVRGIRCPEPIAVGESATGEDYLVMSRIAGDTNPRRLVTGDPHDAMHRGLFEQLADDLVKIHRIAPVDVALAPNMRGPAAGEDPLAYQRRAVEEAYRHDALNAHPAIEWAFRWVDRQIARLDPPTREPCVVHGDFRIGNVLYDDEGLTSILDWEGTHVSEPEEDLAWFCTRVWRFGRNDREAGGIAGREEWLDAYDRISTNPPVSRQRVAVWEVLQNIRWCAITMMQARAHLYGHTNSHELAAIGRRTAETELEVLRLTGVGERVRHAG